MATTYHDFKYRGKEAKGGFKPGDSGSVSVSTRLFGGIKVAGCYGYDVTSDGRSIKYANIDEAAKDFKLGAARSHFEVYLGKKPTAAKVVKETTERVHESLSPNNKTPRYRRVPNGAVA